MPMYLHFTRYSLNILVYTCYTLITIIYNGTLIYFLLFFNEFSILIDSNISGFFKISANNIYID